jgi:hypothetical protein
MPPVVIALALIVPSVARAQPAVPEERAADIPLVALTEEGPSHWERGAPRVFLAAAIDLGFQYFRPRFSTGYGRPHDAWIGLDLNPIVQGSGAGGYVGLRGDGGPVDLRVGGRYFRSWTRTLLSVRDTYTRDDVELRENERATYLSFEAELTAAPALGPGEVLMEVAGTLVSGVPEDRYVFEETIRVVVAPPFALRGRIGYALRLTTSPLFRLAPVFEAVHVTERNATVLRAGIIGRIRLYDDLEIRFNFVPVLSSTDSLGLLGGDFAQLGVRYLWATE